MKNMIRCCLLLVLAGVNLCARGDDLGQLNYRVELMTPGGVLPFMLVYEHSLKSAIIVDPDAAWYIVNAGERTRRLEVESSAERYGYGSDVLFRHQRRHRVTRRLVFDGHDGELVWHTFTGFRPADEPERGDGVWRTQHAGEAVEIPIMVTRLSDDDQPGSDARFTPIHPRSLPDPEVQAGFAGRWEVTLGLADEPRLAVFEVDESQLANGTFGLAGAEIRNLSGRVDGPYMRLSYFDGERAVLIHARMQGDGTIEGELWEGDWRHETWTAERVEP